MLKRFKKEYEIENTVTYKVPFFDVDAMNIVWHGNYVKYFEIGREALLDKINYGYKRMGADGYMWPMIECYTKHRSPVCYEDKIAIRAMLLDYENFLKIGYVITNLTTNKIACEGFTVQVAVDIKTKETQLVTPKVFLDEILKHVKKDY